MASTATNVPEEHNGEEEENPPHADDEDTGAQVAPIVKLEVVAVTTGEEDEDPILDLKAKLYRFDKDGNQWKERGVGNVKLLKHNQTGKVRLVMRQSKTLKICANHLVLPTMTVQEHAGNHKSCVWHATDFADGELKEELFAIRFSSVERVRAAHHCGDGVASEVGRCGTPGTAHDWVGVGVRVAGMNRRRKDRRRPAKHPRVVFRGPTPTLKSDKGDERVERF